jgi:hypothetical protein
MARIPRDPPRPILTRVARWYPRRSYGSELDPAAAMGHHPGVLLSSALQEGALARCHRLDPALVELTMMVAVENTRSRFNAALGLSSKGFRDRCEVPTA